MSRISRKKAKRCARETIEHYRAFHVPLKMSLDRIAGSRMIFKVKFLPGTTESKIRTHLGDVKQALGLQLFQLHREGRELFFVASEQEFTNNRLLRILTHKDYPAYTENMLIPYAVGFDVMESAVIDDIASLPHLLIGGASTSGKTVGVQCLTVSIVGAVHQAKSI